MKGVHLELRISSQAVPIPFSHHSEITAGICVQPNSFGLESKMVVDQGYALQLRREQSQQEPMEFPSDKGKLGVYPMEFACLEVDRPIPKADTKCIVSAEIELFLNWGVQWEIRRNVMTIDAVHASFAQKIGYQKEDEFIRKQNIDVRCQDKLATCSPDADVFGDHLEQRETLRVLEAIVNLCRHSNNTNTAWAEIRRPKKCFSQPRSIDRRIPLYQDKFGPKAMSLA